MSESKPVEHINEEIEVNPKEFQEERRGRNHYLQLPHDAQIAPEADNIIITPNNSEQVADTRKSIAPSTATVTSNKPTVSRSNDSSGCLTTTACCILYSPCLCWTSWQECAEKYRLRSRYRECWKAAGRQCCCYCFGGTCGLLPIVNVHIADYHDASECWCDCCYCGCPETYDR